MRESRWALVAVCCWGILLPQSSSGDSRTSNGDGIAGRSLSKVNFARDIQPILASRCVHCHGPGDAESGLRLDHPDSAMSELESGQRAIVPGNPDSSELMRRISADEFERMPPEGQPLTAAEIAKLRAWIEAGADWPDHWAYLPLNQSQPPRFEQAEREQWVRNPIDRFILKSLVDLGLRPAPPADRIALIRRLHVDLIGLPPTPEEVEAFLNDDSPDAYEKVVDRLLASPHYGERWARHWMDVVHYADSHGFEHDVARSIWPYRDYLIDSFNTDKPYSRFVREQVAGDVLFPNDPQAIAATGFLATGPWDLSALQAGNMDSIDHKISQYLDRDDIVSTVMSTFTSSTVHCARCHDHKFDPITLDEYYGLQAVFAGIDKAHRKYDPNPEIAQHRRTLQQRDSDIQRMLQTNDRALLAPEIEEQVDSWEQKLQEQQAFGWHVLNPIETRSAHGATLELQDDGSLLSTGERPEKDVYTIVARTNPGRIAAIRLEAFSDDRLPHKGPGRQDNGNFHLNEITLTVAPHDDPSATKPVNLVRPQADFNQNGWSIEKALDGNPSTAWGIYPEVGTTHQAMFELEEPIDSDEPLLVTIELHQIHGGGHLIGRARLSLASEIPSDPWTTFGPPPAIAEVLAIPVEERTEPQRIQLAGYYLERSVKQELEALPEQQLVYCGTNQFEAQGGFRPATTPRPVHVLHRGEITTPGDLAVPGALNYLSALPGHFELSDDHREGQRRAALADWIADYHNVLTWRSIANRLWHYHFGRGLVDTPNDFGRMGSAPTHPELLDWLAVTLQQNGESLKSLHRLIVTSATYRQSTQHNPEAAKLDADNHFLWRMNRRRLDAESIRDALLCFSGTLDRTMGGPPVKQFIETKTFNLRPEADYTAFDVDNPANYRRSVYRFVYRTIPDPFMAALDCPDGTQLAPTRETSITSLQALATVNDKFVVRQSELIAERLESEMADLPAQVERAFRLILHRAPREQERQAVIAYAQQHGLANACRFLLNTNEFIFVE